MPKFRFVQPAVVRLDIGDGDWVEIKEQISYGEDQKLTGLLMQTMRPGSVAVDQEVGMNYAAWAVEKLSTWLVDWSLRDADDKPVPVSKPAIENLTPEAAEAINAAINAYLAKRQEGKAPTSASGSAAS